MAEVQESDVIRGVYVVDPRIFGDERGFFIETYRREWIPKAREMIQANRADRQRGSVVGFHYHLHQADYWYVPFGTARMILHDLREGSPTDGATIQKVVADLINTPDDIVAKAKLAMEPKDLTERPK